MKVGIKIRKDIIELIKMHDRPLSTREIALDLGRAWHTIQNHCLRLQLDGKVRGFTVGHMNLWEPKD